MGAAALAAALTLLADGLCHVGRRAIGRGVGRRAIGGGIGRLCARKIRRADVQANKRYIGNGYVRLAFEIGRFFNVNGNGVLLAVVADERIDCAVHDHRAIKGLRPVEQRRSAPIDGAGQIGDSAINTARLRHTPPGLGRVGADVAAWAIVIGHAEDLANVGALEAAGRTHQHDGKPTKRRASH